MKKEFILIAVLIFSGIILFLSLTEFKNPISALGNIEQNYFILAAGIDKGTENDKFKLTLIAEKFSGESGESGKSSSSQGKIPDIVSTEGSTMSETIRNFTSFKSKNLFWGHIKYILISEDIAKENILDVLDFFIRNHELRFDAKVIIVKDISAESFLRSGDKLGNFVPDLLDGVFHNVGKLSISKEIKVLDLMKWFNNLYCDAYIPSIGILTRKEDVIKSNLQEGSSSQEVSSSTGGSSSQEVSSSTGGSSSQEVSSSTGGSSSQGVSSQKEEFYLNLDGFATFDGLKLLGYVSDLTARGLNWVHSNVQSGIIVLKDNTDKNVSMEIINSSSKIKINFNGDVPEASIYIKFSVNLDELMSQNDIFSEIELKRLVEQQNNIVKKEAEGAIEYAQKNGIDILMISDEIFHQYPLKWENIKGNWKEIFKTIKITVKVDSNINRTYHIREPLRSKSGEDK